MSKNIHNQITNVNVDSIKISSNLNNYLFSQHNELFMLSNHQSTEYSRVYNAQSILKYNISTYSDKVNTYYDLISKNKNYIDSDISKNFYINNSIQNKYSENTYNLFQTLSSNDNVNQSIDSKEIHLLSNIISNNDFNINKIKKKRMGIILLS